MTIAAAGAALSHVGRVRANNQDSGFAGDHLFVVADGMGGHAGGDIASAIAVQRIAEIDRLDFASPQEAEGALADSLVAANQLIAEAVAEHPELTGMGTTCSAFVRVGNALAIAHIGDSRLYLVRGGELSQITNDHTFVQRLVDTGRISPEEAAVHPRRSVLMRVLGDIDQAPEIDTSILGTVPGDRWLLCSDGLSSYVSSERILVALSRGATADEAAQLLIGEALDHGAPDNVTAVVVDIGDGPVGSPAAPVMVGAAAAPLAFQPPDRERQHRVASLLLHPLRTAPVEASFEPDEDYLEALIAEDRRRTWRRRIVWLVAIALLVAGAVLAATAAWRYTQTQYYVGFSGDRVAVYQGVQASLGPIALSHVVRTTDIARETLPDTLICRQAVQSTVSASSLTDAVAVVSKLRNVCGD